jgi:hypothetical protein
MPTTEPTARRGNMSLGSVIRLADHHWCAAAATPTIITAAHSPCIAGAKIVGTIANAAMSSVILRPLFTVEPRRMKKPDSQPPPTEPMSASR